MAMRDAYKEKVAARLKEWGQIKLLDAKVGRVGADMKVRRAEEIVA